MATIADTSSPSEVALPGPLLSRGRSKTLSTPSPSSTPGAGGSPSVPPMSKIQWTAMMLKAKVAGPQPAEAKQPIKINQYSFEPAPKVADLATKLATKKKSRMPDGYGSLGSNKDAIQRMIAMREDPTFSPKNQPIPVSNHTYTPGRPSPSTKKHSHSSSSPSASFLFSSSLPSSPPTQWRSTKSSSSSSTTATPTSTTPSSSSSCKKLPSHHHDLPENESKQKDQGSGSVVPGIEQPLLTGRRRKVGPLVPSIYATGAPVTSDSFSIERLREHEQLSVSNAANMNLPPTTSTTTITTTAPTSAMTISAFTPPSSPYSPPPSSSASTRGSRDSESTRSTGPSVTTTATTTTILLPPTPPMQSMVSADATRSSPTTTTVVSETTTVPALKSQLKVKTECNNGSQGSPPSLSTTPMSSSSSSSDKRRDSIQKEGKRTLSSPRRHTMGSELRTSAGTPTGTKAPPSFSFLTSPPPPREFYDPPLSLPSPGQTCSRLPPSPSSPFSSLPSSSSTSLSSSPPRPSFHDSLPPMPTTALTTIVTPSSPMSPNSTVPLQVKSSVNPTLRQLQTPHIPTNLVQARIQQNEEKKRHDEELAKIPITANLRSVKKIHAVMIDDLTPPSSMDSLSVDGGGGLDSGSSTTSSTSTSRPRSRTTSSAQDCMPGGKRRGDRAHIEAVAIPKSLAEKVEGILSRKMAGKGCLLDEMEKLREEEEIKAAKAATLPPIVLGQPRKRALTSSHIKNLVSSWDTKVEAANQTTLEAERSRKFLEERSHARAELPKFLGMNPLVQPPAMPAPPPTSSSSSSRDHGKVSRPSSRKSFSVSTTSTHRGSSTSLSAPSSRAVSPVEKPTMRKRKEEKADEGKEQEEEAAAAAKETTNTRSDHTEPEVKDQEKKEVVSSTPFTHLPVVPEVERSGEVLVHKAIVSRPRRKNVRATAA